MSITMTCFVLHRTPDPLKPRRKVQVGDRVRITGGEHCGRTGVIEKYLGICDTSYRWTAMVRFDDGSLVKEGSGRIEYVGEEAV